MRIIYKISVLTCTLVLSAGFVACGGDSGTSAKDDESSSSIVDESSSSKNSSSSIATSSSSSRNDNAKSSSSVSSSSSSSVVPSSSQNQPSSSSSENFSSSFAESSSSDESSSSVMSSSSSIASGSSEERKPIPYTTECPAGHVCTYAPTKQLNPDITYGEFLDTRDYQVYKTVTIGTQTWMAQNLNYAYTGVPYSYTSASTTYESDSTSWCFNNVADSCAKYGRLYTWAAAIDSVALAKDGYTCGYDKTCDRLTDETLAANPIRGVCPSGWHLPSDEEWNSLFTAVGGISNAGTKLKSASGWYNSGNGNDSFGFAVLPAGYRTTNGVFYYVGYYADFWSSTEYSSYRAYYWNFYYNPTSVYFSSGYKDYGYSVRCLRD